MKRLFSAVFLLLVSTAACASTTIHGFQAASGDLSISYLGQIFGTVGNVVSGSTGQMLGHLFAIFNKGIMVVAALWLAYTVVTIVFRSSQEGSFMGPNKNVAFIIFRIAIGFALIIPSPSTGYSFLQDIVMKVVVEGVGLADNTWSAALQYLDNGGTLYLPTQYGTSTQIKKSAGPITAVENTIFADEVCMFQAHNWQNQMKQEASGSNGSGSNSSVYVNSNGQPAPYYHIAENQAKNTISFQGPNGKAGCGSIVGYGGASNDAATKYGAAAWGAMRGLVVDLLPAARRYTCKLDPNKNKVLCKDTQGSIDTNNKPVFLKAMLSYYNLMEPYARKLQKKVSKDAKKLNSNAAKYGWVMAGRYYWNLSQADRYYRAANVSSLMPTATLASGLTTPHLQGDVKGAKTYAQNNYSKYAKGKGLDKYLKAQDAGTNGEVHVNNKGLNFFLRMVLPGSVFSQLLLDFGQVHSNPITFLMDIGQDCLGAAVAIWAAGLGAIAVLGFAAGVCNSTSPGGVLFNNMIGWVKPVTLGVAGALIIPGIILGYYLPLYPYILFTFGTIGWIMLVLEAMVAAPLVCFGLTHPEGHDFLGKAEQALILLLGVFLRPVLMVIGLIAAIIVSYVALKLLIYGFTGILGSLYGFGSSGAHDVLLSSLNAAIDSNLRIPTSPVNFGTEEALSIMKMMVVFPSLLIIFSGLVYMIVQQCFSLIHVLPDNIMQWIGGPQKQDMTSSMAKQLEGVTSGGSKVLGDNAGQTLAGGGETGGRSAAGKFSKDAKGKIVFNPNGGGSGHGGS